MQAAPYRPSHPSKAAINSGARHTWDNTAEPETRVVSVDVVQEATDWPAGVTATSLAERDLRLVFDDYATHKHSNVLAWLERHPRFHFHFTPTSASWLNAVEGFFAKLTKRRLKCGVFTGILDLQAAINRFLK